MILARSPLRITLGGGGTDLPSYYRDHGGVLVAAAIDKYVYVSVLRRFTEGILLKYSRLESCETIEELEHPIVREALRYLNPKSLAIEIGTMADIPAGTGLGSSGSFATAFLKSFATFEKKMMGADEIAELACHIEIDVLGEPIGKQDQYISAYGGITCFTFNQDDTVTNSSLEVSQKTLFDLEDNLLLFFTGFSRSASVILKDQDVKSRQCDAEMLSNLHYIKELGLRSRDALLGGNTELFGELLHEHWAHKKRRSGGMSNPKIDEWYELGMKNGALGGKLVGAGGGGFLMFMAYDRDKLRHAMAYAGLEEVRFKFDFEGTKVVMSS